MDFHWFWHILDQGKNPEEGGRMGLKDDGSPRNCDSEMCDLIFTRNRGGKKKIPHWTTVSYTAEFGPVFVWKTESLCLAVLPACWYLTENRVGCTVLLLALCTALPALCFRGLSGKHRTLPRTRAVRWGVLWHDSHQLQETLDGLAEIHTNRWWTCKNKLPTSELVSLWFPL